MKNDQNIFRKPSSLLGAGTTHLCCTPRRQPELFSWTGGFGMMQFASGTGAGSTAEPYVPGMKMLPALDMSGKNAVIPCVVYSYGAFGKPE